MSNRAHRRRRGVRPSTAQTVASGTIAAAAAGCTCQPEITRRHADGMWHLDLAHDNWCPAVNAPSSAAIWLLGTHRGGTA